jgi:hypothetical protein
MEPRHRLVMAPMELAVAPTDVCSSELTDIGLSTWHLKSLRNGALQCRCSEARSRVMTSIG